MLNAILTQHKQNAIQRWEKYRMIWALLAGIHRSWTSRSNGCYFSHFRVGILSDKHFKRSLSTEHEVSFCTSLCKQSTDEVTVHTVCLSGSITLSCRRFISDCTFQESPATGLWQQELQRRKLIRQFCFILLFRLSRFNLFASYLFIDDFAIKINPRWDFVLFSEIEQDYKTEEKKNREVNNRRRAKTP